MKLILMWIFALLLLAACSQPTTPASVVMPSDAPSTTPLSTSTYLPPSAHTDTPLPTLSPTRTASPTPISVTRSLEYCRMDERALLLDVYSPASGAPPYPAVIFIHGGGWTQGGKGEANGFPAVRALLNAGYTVFSIDYRLAPANPFPAQIQDARCAVRWLRANAARFDVNPDAIAAMGTSAGGHLSALLGLTAGEPRWPSAGGFEDQSESVQAVVDFYGPVALSGLYDVGLSTLARDVFGASGRDDPALSEASPITYVDDSDAPVLIVHGDQDRQVLLSQSQEFYAALQAAGVESQLIVVENGGHGFTGSGFTPGWDALNAAIVAFLDQHLR